MNTPKIVTLEEGGVGIAWRNGTKRAEWELLDDGQAFLTLYDAEGEIQVFEDIEPSNALSRAKAYLGY